MIKIEFALFALLVALSLSFASGFTFAQLSNSSNQTSENSTFIPITNISSIPNTEIDNYNYNSSQPLQNQIINETSKDMPNNNFIIVVPKISSESILTKLYNTTINSIVEITSYDKSNQSNFKMGTGFIADINGTSFLITSNNLVTMEDNVTVTMSDGDRYDSMVLGSDPVANVVVLSLDNISTDKIIPLKVANSSDLKVGQGIATIGNKVGFSNLFTTGFISGLEKSIPTFGQNVSSSLTKVPNGIITDMDVDSSSYGGSPLLNLEGELIGMNIQNHSTDIQKVPPISFAIPSNSISKIIPELSNKGFYLHPWLGVSGTDVTPDIAEILKLDESRGFLVIAVTDQSPAELAGLLGGDNVTNVNGLPITLGGDIILKVDDKDIETIHDVLSYIENEKNVGDNMVVTVLRNGILQSINVNLQANPNFVPVEN